MSEWQPIETAPRDETPLLVGWWQEWPKREWKCEVSSAGNLDIHDYGGYLHGYATHWQPLPDPPNPQEEP